MGVARSRVAPNRHSGSGKRAGFLFESPLNGVAADPNQTRTNHFKQALTRPISHLSAWSGSIVKSDDGFYAETLCGNG